MGPWLVIGAILLPPTVLSRLAVSDDPELRITAVPPSVDAVLKTIGILAAVGFAIYEYRRTASEYGVTAFTGPPDRNNGWQRFSEAWQTTTSRRTNPVGRALVWLFVGLEIAVVVAGLAVTSTQLLNH